MMIQRGLFGWSPPHIQPLTPVSEVSEPPETPSPYSPEGGNNDLQVDPDDEMDEDEEMEAPPAAVPFSKLFVCADKLDWCLMVVGSVAAAAHGTALVVYLHYFAKIVQLLAHGGDDPDVLFDKFKDVRSVFCI
nr:ABC transporter B family member 6-like [Tanacetum cinerariifolium]